MNQLSARELICCILRIPYSTLPGHEQVASHEKHEERARRLHREDALHGDDTALAPLGGKPPLRAAGGIDQAAVRDSIRRASPHHYDGRYRRSGEHARKLGRKPWICAD